MPVDNCGGADAIRDMMAGSVTKGGAIAVQPLVPGFVITGELTLSATGSTWGAVRTLDGRPFVLKVLSVTDVTQAHALATRQMAVVQRIQSEHVVGLHGAIALADGTLALVLDQVIGGSLAQLLGARGQLTPGETVTTLAPLLTALADLHGAGVVHGDLAPGNVLFSADGRPLISDLGVAPLLGRHTLSDGAGTGGFLAPEIVAGAVASPASDVYAMAALGWFCLAGAAPGPAATRLSLTTFRPATPGRLVEILTSCLATDPAARPSAAAAAAEVFDAATAESVALAPASDPAAEITRRIRAAAVSAPTLAPRSARKSRRRPLAISIGALVMAVALGSGAAWSLRHRSDGAEPVVVRSVAQPLQSRLTTSSPPVPSPTEPSPAPRKSTAAPAFEAPTTSQPATPHNLTEVLKAPGSPRIAAASLLQALVDARAVAYVSRHAALLDLVYAPGATMADVDRANIATALKNGATYLGLAFVAQDVAFLDGTSGTVRIRATILTPAYRTGQPDGRKVPHGQDTVGPSVFTLSLTPDGWRILSLTAP
jgi:eukaryotic-like serine/threonine-protein kinase